MVNVASLFIYVLSVPGHQSVSANYNTRRVLVVYLSIDYLKCGLKIRGYQDKEKETKKTKKKKEKEQQGQCQHPIHFLHLKQIHF